MSTNHVYFMGPDDCEEHPRIDFSLPENRCINWLPLGEMLDGLREPDFNYLSALNIKLVARSSRFDCLSFNARLLVSALAKEFISTSVPDSCLFLPIRINSQPFFFLVPRKVLDVLNKEASEVEFFPHDKNRVMIIRKYRFKKEQIDDPSIFQIPENPIRVFITDSLSKNMKASKLIGFKIVDFENPPSDVYIS